MSFQVNIYLDMISYVAWPAVGSIPSHKTRKRQSLTDTITFEESFFIPANETGTAEQTACTVHCRNGPTLMSPFEDIPRHSFVRLPTPPPPLGEVWS